MAGSTLRFFTISACAVTSASWLGLTRFLVRGIPPRHARSHGHSRYYMKTTAPSMDRSEYGSPSNLFSGKICFAVLVRDYRGNKGMCDPICFREWCARRSAWLGWQRDGDNGAIFRDFERPSGKALGAGSCAFLAGLMIAGARRLFPVIAPTPRLARKFPSQLWWRGHGTGLAMRSSGGPSRVFHKDFLFIPTATTKGQVKPSRLTRVPIDSIADTHRLFLGFGEIAVESQFQLSGKGLLHGYFVPADGRDPTESDQKCRRRKNGHVEHYAPRAGAGRVNCARSAPILRRVNITVRVLVEDKGRRPKRRGIRCRMRWSARCSRAKKRRRRSKRQEGTV